MVIPTSFQTLRALRLLNIGAVGLAIVGARDAPEREPSEDRAMYILREKQLAAFTRSAGEDFEDRMITHLRAVFAEACAARGEVELRALITLGIERAAGWGLELEYESCLYLHVMLALGERFDEDPGLPWARAALESGGWGPSSRIEHLHDLVFLKETPPDPS